MKKIAFFDFDNTLYRGFTYQDVINYASDKILKNDEYILRSRKIIEGTGDYNKRVLDLANLVGEMITGWDGETFKQCCHEACSTNKIFDWVMPVLQYLKSEGFTLVIVTASFKVMLSGSLKILPMDEVYCSEFERKEGIYTGKIDLLLNAEEKVRAIKNHLLNDDTLSLAFGDSMGDAPMLDAVNLPFLVNSYDRAIEKIARERGWHMGDKPEEIIDRIKNYLTSI
jgi:HAD superfamily hydrolase (TIGR01490 family)